MKFSWIDYDSDNIVETWLDDETKAITGLGPDFLSFFNYWKDNEDEDSLLNDNFWCKVIQKEKKPIAVIAFGLWDGAMTIMELVLDQADRNKGYGSDIIQELLNESQQICGYPISKASASIYEHNLYAQKAFKKAGFRFQYADEDLAIWHYTFIRQ